jgi:hypothetical protein
MSKFLLNLLLQISKALINSKIQFLIQKFLFPDFRPGRPRGPLGLWPSPPTDRPVPAGQNRRAGPSSPCVSRVFTGNTFSSSVHAFPSRPPPPHLSNNRAPLVSSVFPTMPADPGREPSAPLLPTSPAPHLRCRQAFTAPPPLIISPLNPLQTEP